MCNGAATKWFRLNSLGCELIYQSISFAFYMYTHITFLCYRLRRGLLLLVAVSSTLAQSKPEDSLQAVPSDLKRAVSEALALERRYLLGANDA